jgi:hypothetical protein
MPVWTRYTGKVVLLDSLEALQQVRAARAIQNVKTFLLGLTVLGTGDWYVVGNKI